MQGSFSLGEWVVEPATNRLIRNGHGVHVRAKVMDLLVFMAQRPGEVCSKDTLMQGVWRTDALSESALTRSMTELRQALEDDVEQPNVIETIPKRGYRLIAPVHPVALPTASKVRCVVWGFAGLLLGIAAAGLSMMIFSVRVPAHDPAVVRFLITPPEGSTFSALPLEPQPAISPDGRQVAIVAMARYATRTLWVQTLDSLAARQLAGTEDAGFPFWSPDGRWIGFFAQGKLKKIRISGGPPEVLCDAAEGFGGTWNANGTVLFAPSRGSGLSTVLASGGTPAHLTILDASHHETSHRFPQFLPDGRHYIYLVRSGGAEHRGIFLGSIGSNARTRLTDADSNAALVQPGYLLFVRGSALMAQRFDLRRLVLTGEPVPVAERVLPAPTVRFAPFSVSSSGVLTYRPGGTLKTRLTWADREGRTLGSIGAPARYLTPTLSPDGRRLAVDILDLPSGAIDTWIFDLARNVSSRFTLGPALDGNPVWAPDGRRIVFASNRGGPWNLYEQSLDERPLAEHLLLKSGTDEYPQTWSADGQSLVYVDRSDATGRDLWVLPMFGARKPVPFLQTPFNETQAQLSPDGRWLAYMSDETGRFEIYVRPFPSSGGKWLVSTEGGCQPRWRADGKELFYLHGQRLMAVPIEADSSLKPGMPTMLFNMRVGRTSDVAWEYVSAPDGRFLFKELVFEEDGSPLVVVLNWHTLLERASIKRSQ